jgi:hypothetical protein
MSTGRRIFLAHAREDKTQVRKLYADLKARGLDPWLDEEDLVAGKVWKEEIRKAIREAGVFLACLSSGSVGKVGYIQNEFGLALSGFGERPPGSIFLIPVRLDECDLPDLQIPDRGLSLRDIQWVDLWQEGGFDRLVRALEHALAEVTDPRPASAKAQKAIPVADPRTASPELQAPAQDTENELAAVRTELDQARMEADGLRVQLAEAETNRKEQALLEAALTKTKKDLSTAVRQTEELRRKLTDADKTGELRVQLASVQRERAVLEADLKRVTNDLAIATDEARELRRKLADAEDAQNGWAASTADLDRAHAEVQSLQEQLAVERRRQQQQRPSDKAGKEPVRQIDQDVSFQPGIIQLDRDLQVIGGLDAVELAVFECLESVSPSKHPVPCVEVEELGDIIERIDWLTAKQPMTMEERKERLNLISELPKYELGNVCAYLTMYNEIAEILVRRLGPGLRDGSAAARCLFKCLKCIRSPNCMRDEIHVWTKERPVNVRFWTRHSALCHYNDDCQREAESPGYVIPIDPERWTQGIEELPGAEEVSRHYEIVRELSRSERTLNELNSETFWRGFAYPLTMGYVWLRYKEKVDVDGEVFFSLKRWSLKRTTSVLKQFGPRDGG